MPFGDTIPVIGNGMTIGLHSDAYAGLLARSSSYSGTLLGSTGVYGAPIFTPASGGALTDGSVGLTEEPNKSGIIVDLSNSVTAIIKY